MFCNPYFGGGYFAARFWPKIGADIIAGVGRMLALFGVGS